MTEAPARLWQPGAIGTLRLPHRIVMGAMHLGREADDDGGAALAAFYAERAAAGAGLMVTGGAAVSPAGAGGARYGVLSDERFAARLGRVTAAVHEAGGLIALQLFHAGRYAPPTAHGPVAPSAVLSRISGAEPAPLTDQQITATLADFAAAARAAVDLGFDAVEIMASEGYLIDQFLSPLTNLRDDEWGGDPARRARFGTEVTRAVRAAAGPGFPLIVRLTGADLMPGGVSAGEAAAFAAAVAAAGADAVNVGVGWHESPVPTVQGLVPPGHWAPVAGQIRRALAGAGTPVPVIASNRVNRPETAEQILAAGHADFVSLARPFLADPALVARARAGAPVNVCIGCNQACIDRSLAETGPAVSCLVNPRAGNEYRQPLRPRTGAVAGRVAVIGAGPAGLYAARDLAAAGHRVTLFEAGAEPGGQFRLAAKVPGKADYGATVAYLTAELAAAGGKTELGRPVTAADEALLRGFDGLVIATGVRPRPLDIGGAGLPHVLAYADAFRPLAGRVVIIGGGGIAVDLAAYLSAPGAESTPAEVTVLHRGPRLGARLGKSTRWTVLAELRERGVQVRTGVQARQITAAGVSVTGGSGEQIVPADHVVVAIGQQRHDPLAAVAASAGVWHRVIGAARDAAGVDAVRAITEAQQAAEQFSEYRAG